MFVITHSDHPGFVRSIYSDNAFLYTDRLDEAKRFNTRRAAEEAITRRNTWALKMDASSRNPERFGVCPLFKPTTEPQGMTVRQLIAELVQIEDLDRPVRFNTSILPHRHGPEVEVWTNIDLVDDEGIEGAVTLGGEQQ